MKKASFLVPLLLSLCLISYRALLPEYTEVTNITSEKPGYVKHYLVIGNRKYVTDYHESSLEIINNFRGKQVGVTNNRQNVYSIKGQSPEDYLLVTGFMMVETIYRNEQTPIIDFMNTNITEIRTNIGGTQSTEEKRTYDQTLISEVIQVLESKECIAVDDTEISQRLLLLSEHLDGIGYGMYILVDKDKNVYFEEFTQEGKINAGQLFTDWFNKK